MSIYAYAATIHRPHSVQTAIIGNFLSPADKNLIVSKMSRIEIYSLVNGSLTFTKDININCRIESLKAFTLPDQPTCYLFILTEQLTYCVLHCHPTRKTITTKAYGTLEQQNARLSDNIFIDIDFENSTIVISAFNGLLFFIPLQFQYSLNASTQYRWDQDYELIDLTPFDCRIPEYTIRSLVTVDVSSPPTFAILYEQYDGPHLKFYQVNLQEKQVSTRYSVPEALESTCHLLVPVPYPCVGVLAVGEFTIGYFDLDERERIVSIDSVVINAYEFIGDEDKLRCILGDTHGSLYMLTLGLSAGTVKNLYIQYLGKASVCSSIVSLGLDLLYLGSAQADSTLVKLKKEEKGYKLEVVAKDSNLGPIIDFCLYDVDKLGRQSMVCCSGANNDGTLRIVQSGYGFFERAIKNRDDMEHIWAVTSDKLKDKSQHDILVLSSIRETKLLYYPGVEDDKYMEELERFSALDLEAPTLAMGTFENGDIVQVTIMEARLMASTMDLTTAFIWKPTSTIAMATVGNGHCLLSFGFGKLICLRVDYTNRTLVKVSERKFDHEISCMNIFIVESNNQTYAAVGFWRGDNIQIIDLDNLSSISIVVVPEVPRSILFQSFQGEDYLFIALANGKIIYYVLEATSMQLLHQNIITVGIGSIKLHSFVNNGKNMVFVATERPTIISRMDNHLVFSSVNLEGVRNITVFDNSKMASYLAIMTKKTLIFGDMDSVKRLHFSKVPLTKKMGLRIAYHDESRTIIVGTSQLERNPDTGLEKVYGGISIYDARTFQELGCFDLLQYELVESICSSKIFNQDKCYVFVGTARTLPSEPESSTGRIIMYNVNFGRSYELVDAVDMPGVVYCIKSYKDSIVAAVNGSIYYLDSYHPGKPRGKKLKISKKIESNTLALDLDTMGDSILVGDLMKSMSLMKLDDENQKMTIVAKDRNVNWMTAVKMADSDLYIGAEMSHNLFTLKKYDDDVTRMDVVGEYHIGDRISRIHRGTLRDQIDPMEEKKPWTLLYGTVNGAIGTLTGITQQEYQNLWMVQQKLLEKFPQIGRLDYEKWRTFQNSERSGPSRNYIDGDIVQGFLTLAPRQKRMVMASLPFGIDQLQNILNGLSQLR